MLTASVPAGPHERFASGVTFHRICTEDGVREPFWELDGVAW